MAGARRRKHKTRVRGKPWDRPPERVKVAPVRSYRWRASAQTRMAHLVLANNYAQALCGYTMGGAIDTPADRCLKCASFADNNPSVKVVE